MSGRSSMFTAPKFAFARWIRSLIWWKKRTHQVESGESQSDVELKTSFSAVQIEISMNMHHISKLHHTLQVNLSFVDLRSSDMVILGSRFTRRSEIDQMSICPESSREKNLQRSLPLRTYSSHQRSQAGSSVWIYRRLRPSLVLESEANSNISLCS